MIGRQYSRCRGYQKEINYTTEVNKVLQAGEKQLQNIEQTRKDTIKNMKDLRTRHSYRPGRSPVWFLAKALWPGGIV
jgi:hypothetical protein